MTLAEADFDLYETENTRYVQTVEQLREGLEETFPVTDPAAPIPRQL